MPYDEKLAQAKKGQFLIKMKIKSVSVWPSKSLTSFSIVEHCTMHASKYSILFESVSSCGDAISNMVCLNFISKKARTSDLFLFHFASMCYEQKKQQRAKCVRVHSKFTPFVIVSNCVKHINGNLLVAMFSRMVQWKPRNMFTFLISSIVLKIIQSLWICCWMRKNTHMSKKKNRKNRKEFKSKKKNTIE